MTKFKVFYFKPEYSRDIGFGFNPTVEQLDNTHVFLKEVEAKDLEDVFHQMQGEIWSPNGEARELIESKGLWHTSMSVGDVVQSEDGTFHSVEMIGFKKMEV